MKNIFFLLNDLSEFNFQKKINTYLSSANVNIGQSLPKRPEDYDWIVLWSYQKKIKVGNSKNIILFHSTALPEGKGWAPIYYTLAHQKKEFIISGILASDQIDAGPILAKASFEIKDNYTANQIREWDHEISLKMLSKMIEKGEKLQGILQTGEESYYPKRNQESNQIDVRQSFASLIPHLRACENRFPAFFYVGTEKYFVEIKPENTPVFPQDLKIDIF